VQSYSGFEVSFIGQFSLGTKLFATVDDGVTKTVYLVFDASNGVILNSYIMNEGLFLSPAGFKIDTSDNVYLAFGSKAVEFGF
jgi:hypothetical protein